MRYITSFILSLLLISCSEDIDLTLSSTSRFLVVDGHICDKVSPYNYVRLTFSSEYFNNLSSPAVRGAKVVISDGENDIVFVEDEPGFYMAPPQFAGLHGKVYHLSISDVDVDSDGTPESYSAEATMPPTYDIDSVVCSYDKFVQAYKLGLYAREDVETRNFYMFGMSYKDSLITDSYTRFAYTDDRWFASDYCWGATIFMFNDESIKGGKVVEGDTITMHALSINEDFYKYVNAVDDIDSGSNPMHSSTPANAIGNISNGALGFFTAFAWVSSTTTVKR